MLVLGAPQRFAAGCPLEAGQIGSCFTLLFHSVLLGGLLKRHFWGEGGRGESGGAGTGEGGAQPPEEAQDRPWRMYREGAQK